VETDERIELILAYRLSFTSPTHYAVFKEIRMSLKNKGIFPQISATSLADGLSSCIGHTCDSRRAVARPLFYAIYSPRILFANLLSIVTHSIARESDARSVCVS